MSSLQGYLVSVKAVKDTVNRIILGNEAADLDSMASAIAYGYLLSLQDPAIVSLPVMPIPRADFLLRSEAVYVFQEAGIKLENLIFFDEIDFAKCMKTGVDLVLVDHNKLGPSLEKYDSHVTAVLDHHIDEGLYGNAEPRIIRKIGSTASLVGMAFGQAGVTIPENIAILLSGTILLDTVNLDEKAGRVTDADIAIVEILLPLCPLPRDVFFNTIQREKFNIAGLSTADLFRKDYKEYHFDSLRCGIGAALLSIHQWQEIDPDLFSGVAGFAADRRLDLFLSMNTFADPGFKRDLLVYCTTKEMHDALVVYLQKNLLDLVLYGCAGNRGKGEGYIGCYRQGNLGISRKKLQPLLVELYK